MTTLPSLRSSITFIAIGKLEWLELHPSLIISTASKESDSTMTLSKILFVPVEFRRGLIELSGSLFLSGIFDVEVGGGTCKRNSVEQVSGALRCLYVYNWNEKNVPDGISYGLYIHFQC